MKYMIIALLAGLALTGSAEAQLFERDDGPGWRHHEREEGYRWRRRERVICHCWRDHQRDEGPRWRWRLVREDGDYGWRHRWRHHVRHYGESWRHRERYEGYRRRHRERDEGHDWRPPERREGRDTRDSERDEGRGWRPPERREGRDWRDSERHDGRGYRCRPPMHAAGDADAREETAHNMAIKAWQEQVINEHGERYINFAAAYVLDEHCDPARVGENNLLDLKRCVITAAPCLTRPREGERRREEERSREEERR